MKRIVLGVIGHVDHGKTALVRALTGQETDRLAEEKRRGISIALGFAHMQLGGVHLDLIDMPGHERFVRTMIAGSTGIDAVLLVVSANEGIKPQTREHIDIAALLGVRRAVIAISKADLVSEDDVALAAEEVMLLAQSVGLDAPPPIVTSSLSGQGIEELKSILAGLAASQSPRSSDGIPYLPIDRAFSIAGHGPVVTGTLRGGPITAGDTLQLHPPGGDVRVKAVQQQDSRVEAAMPGQRTAVNLRDVEIADLKSGMALAAPGLLAASAWLTISVRSLGSSPALNNGMRLRALFGTSESEVRLRLLDRDVLDTGQAGFAQLRFTEPVAVPARERVVLRLISPSRTVAGGLILDTEMPRQRRNNMALLERLDDRLRLPPAEMIAGEILRSGGTGLTVVALSKLSGLAPQRVKQILGTLRVVVTRTDVVMDAGGFEALCARIVAHLEKNSTGLSAEGLEAAFPGFDKRIVEDAIRRLAADGKLERREGRIAIPRPAEHRARELREIQIAAGIVETLRKAGLTPPTSSEIMKTVDAKRAVDRIVQAGVIVRAMDRVNQREILFHKDAIATAQKTLLPLLQAGSGLLVSEIGAALGISRKYSIPLLDYLDRVKFTRRIEDRRIAGAMASPVAKAGVRS